MIQIVGRSTLTNMKLKISYTHKLHHSSCTWYFSSIWNTILFDCYLLWIGDMSFHMLNRRSDFETVIEPCCIYENLWFHTYVLIFFFSFFLFSFTLFSKGQIQRFQFHMEDNVDETSIIHELKRTQAIHVSTLRAGWQCDTGAKRTR